jgi:hypothetical protein
MIGYSDEKKGYRLLSNGKFIVSRDVIFDETESKSAEEIESLLQKLETKGNQRQRKPNSHNWYELDFPSSEDDTSSPVTSTTSSGSSSSSSDSPSSRQFI